MSHRDGFPGLLLPTESSRRAFEETLADWREERLQTTSALGRIRTDISGAVSVLRVGARSAGADLVRPEVWRLVSVMLVAALILAVVNPIGWAYLFNTLGETPFVDAARIGLFLIPGSLPTAFVLACAAGVGQRRHSTAPALAAMIVSSALMFALLGWVTPAANQEFRIAVWESKSTTLASADTSGAPVPGVNEATLPQLVAKSGSTDPSVATSARRTLAMRTALFLALPTGFLLGAAVRARLRDGRSWRIAQAAGALTLLGIIIATDLATGVLLQLLEWPTREFVTRFNPELWLALAVAWSLILILARSSPNPEPGTSPANPAP